MTDADEIMNPQHFGSDPADILDSNPGSVLVEMLAVMGACAVWVFSNCECMDDQIACCAH